jgi:hypothetical protein
MNDLCWRSFAWSCAAGFAAVVAVVFLATVFALSLYFAA